MRTKDIALIVLMQRVRFGSKATLGLSNVVSMAFTGFEAGVSI